MLYSLHRISINDIKPLNQRKLSVRMGHKAKGPVDRGQVASYQWKAKVYPFCGPKY